MLVNLVGNAVKFTEQGEIELVVARGCPRKPAPAGRVWITFSVRDTGIGIAPENLGHLFQPFSQADASTSRRFGGTGLGLAICRRLCQRMGGEIAVQSRLGDGSEFTVELPLESREQPWSEPPAALADETPAEARPPRAILVAEDNHINQCLAQQLLRKLGYRSDVAGNGLEAVEGLRRQPYDVVLMDMQMPEMDGLEATRRIRDMNLPRQPWIIALTANVQAEARRQCLEAGMDDYLSKPIAFDQLARAMDRAVAATAPQPALNAR